MSPHRRTWWSGILIGFAVVTSLALGCAGSASAPEAGPTVETPVVAQRVVRGVVDLPAGIGPDGVDVVLLEPVLLCVWEGYWSTRTMYLTERVAARVALGADRGFELTVPRGVTEGRLALAGRGLLTEKILPLPETDDTELRLRAFH